jgi:UDP-glucose 4-epimerase
MAPTTLITGGAGFIGSHLATRLTGGGEAVRIVDDLSTGRRENLAHLPQDQVELVVADAAEYLTRPNALRGIHRVYHLAAAVGVQLIVDQPAAMIRNNVEKTAAVLEACADAGLPVLIASSSEVYGKCPVLPLREDMDLVFGPTSASRWSYGMTKAIDEHLAIDLARQRGLRSVVVRLFNTIGPRQVGRYGMVVPRFVSAATAGQPLTVYGDGSQTRAFCDVRDVVDAMTRLMDEPDAYGRVFNIGSDQQTTIDQLADRVIALTASRSEGRLAPTKRYVSYEAAYGEGFEDPPHRLPDLTRLRETIGFSPGHSLEQTLTELIDELLLPSAIGPTGGLGEEK